MNLNEIQFTKLERQERSEENTQQSQRIRLSAYCVRHKTHMKREVQRIILFFKSINEANEVLKN